MSHITTILSASIIALSSFSTAAFSKNVVNESVVIFDNGGVSTTETVYINGTDRKDNWLPPNSSMRIMFNLPLEDSASIRFIRGDESCTLHDFGKRANRYKDCEKSAFTFAYNGTSCEFNAFGMNCFNPALNQPQTMTVPMVKTSGK